MPTQSAVATMGGAVLLFGCHALPTSPILLLDGRADRTTIKQDEVAQVSAASQCLGDNVNNIVVVIIARSQISIKIQLNVDTSSRQ